MFTNAWRGGTVFFNNNYIFVHYLGPVNFNNKYNKGNAKRGISPRLKI